MFFRAVASVSILSLLAACAPPKLTATTPEGQFKEAEQMFATKHYEEAITDWKKVKEGSGPKELIALAELRIADAHFASKSYIEAAADYENFRKLHPNHEKAPYALYRLGLCHFNEMDKIDTEQTPVKSAVTSFENFLAQYPDSEYAREVKEKLAICRTRQLQYEIYIGRFYYRTKKYTAAIGRLEGALANFPANPADDEALYYLGAAYLKNGEKEKGVQALDRLLKEYSGSKFAPDAKKLLKKQ